MAVTDWGDANSRFLGLVSVGATRSLRPSVIKIIRQMTVKTHNTNANGNVQKRRPWKNNMAFLRSKNETVVIRMIYNKNTLKFSNTLAAYGGTGSSVKNI